jgi:hypothetical protein
MLWCSCRPPYTCRCKRCLFLYGALSQATTTVLGVQAERSLIVLQLEIKGSCNQALKSRVYATRQLCTAFVSLVGFTVLLLFRCLCACCIALRSNFCPGRLRYSANMTSALSCSLMMMSSLQVTKTTYSGLQEHRIMKYTATGHKAKAKEQMSTETTDTGHLCNSLSCNLF